nr:hypothetical protein [Tanacetum cinerariifolium]
MSNCVNLNVNWARVVGLSWEGVEIHGRSSGSGGEGRGNHGRVDVGLAGNLVSEQEFSNVGRRQGSIIVYFTQLVPGLVRD